MPFFNVFSSTPSPCNDKQAKHNEVLQAVGTDHALINEHRRHEDAAADIKVDDRGVRVASSCVCVCARAHSAPLTA